MTTKLTAPVVMLLAAAGCGGQIGEEQTNDGTHCVLDASEALGEDDATDLGPSVAELRAWIDGERTSTMVWADDTESEMTLTVTSSGEASWNTYTTASSDDGTEPLIDIACEPDLTIPATVSITTADGRLDETWTHEVRLTEASQATFWRDLDTIAGTLDVESFITETDYDAYDAHFTTTLQDDGSIAGEVTGSYEGTTGTGPDSAVWQSVLPIGTFGDSDADEP